MNVVQKIAKNTVFLLIAQIVSLSFGFFTTMYMARYLGAEGFGLLSFALAITAIFKVFTDMGMATLTTREVAKNELLAQKYLGNTAIIKFVLSLVVFFILSLLINILGYPEKTTSVVHIIFISVIIMSFSNIFYSIFQAYEKMEYLSLGQTLNSIFMFFGVLFAINQEFDVFGFSIIYLITSVILFAINLGICLSKFDKPDLRFDWNFAKETFKKGFPFGLSSIFITIYYYIDTVMLSAMLPNGNEVVGWYNAAYRLILVLLFIPSIYSTVMFPVMSKAYHDSQKSLNRIIEKSLKYMLILCIPIVIGTTFLSNKIILLIFGIDYLPSVIILKILVWSFIFACVGSIFGYFLNSIDEQKTLTKIVGMGMLLNIVLNLILIPRYSYIGAGIATDFTRFFVIFAEFIILSKIGFNLQNSLLLKTVLKSLIACLIMCGMIILMQDFHLLIIVFTSAFLYLFLIYRLNIFDEDDFNLFKSISFTRKYQRNTIK